MHNRISASPRFEVITSVGGTAEHEEKQRKVLILTVQVCVSGNIRQWQCGGGKCSINDNARQLPTARTGQIAFNGAYQCALVCERPNSVITTIRRLLSAKRLHAKCVVFISCEISDDSKSVRTRAQIRSVLFYRIVPVIKVNRYRWEQVKTTTA